MTHQVPMNRVQLLRTESETDRSFGMRCINTASIRAAGEENSRRFIVSFSSEEPYMRWFGLEILSHDPDAVDLSRLNEIGVVLFNHNVGQVCGKILRAWIENERGQAEIEFDTDDAAELIYQKVKSGTLKATSVRYSVDAWEEVAAGKQSADKKFTGPCSVARKWTPLEISIVSVPADATVGVGRSHISSDHKNKAERGRSIRELQSQLNKRDQR